MEPNTTPYGWTVDHYEDEIVPDCFPQFLYQKRIFQAYPIGFA